MDFENLLSYYNYEDFDEWQDEEEEYEYDEDWEFFD